jgi:hypothetical protein
MAERGEELVLGQVGADRFCRERLTLVSLTDLVGHIDADGDDVTVASVALILNRRKHKIPVPLLGLGIAMHRKCQFPHDVPRARRESTVGFLANGARPVEGRFGEGFADGVRATDLVEIRAIRVLDDEFAAA